jgi:hypothetical protein
VPPSKLLVSQPRGNAGSALATYSGQSVGSCSGGFVTKFYDGAYLSLGN